MNKADFSYSVSNFIGSQCGVECNDRLLVALSGGADSVALLRVLLDLGFNCVAAHCNFHLRGDESMRDEQFVHKLCKHLDIPLHVKDFDVEAYRRGHGVSVEMACRELRYSWFKELLEKDNCDYVAVAHHRDDNIETVFLNMLRGTGIAGVTGMKARNGRIIRPLLCVSRADVAEYLYQIGQDFVTDSTNLSNDYQRNKVRNVLLKDIDHEFPSGRERISDTMRNLAEWHELCDELINDIVDGCRMPQCDDSKEVFSLSQLRSYSHPKLLLNAMLTPFGFNINQCEQMEALICDENRLGNAHFYSSTNTATLSCENIIVENINDDKEDAVKVNLDDVSKLPVKLEVLHCEMPFDATNLDGKYTVAFDSRLLKCEQIVLRRWREGDRMRPFGMKGTRLLSDIFSDAHLTLQQKKQVWILEADGEILWLLGLRASHVFQVTDSSAGYIVLSVDNHSILN